MNPPEPANDHLSASFTDEDRFRLLVNAVTDYAIYMLDPSGHIVSWNAGAERFMGYDADEIIGRHFSLLYTEDDKRAGIPAYALKVAATERKFETEGWRVRKDGARFWAHVVIDPIFEAAGKLIGFVKVTRDLTERKHAEQTLHLSQEEHRLLVESVTDYAIYMLDPLGKVVSWNTGAQRIKGYLPEEIIGHNFSRFYTEEDRKAGVPQRALATAIEQGHFEKEGVRVRKDGSHFWASVVIDPIRAADGRILGFAKITRDITERYETQKKLDEARETLLQSQKMDAIGKLTGGIAHDFNNLLTAILGSLELIQKRAGRDPQVASLVANAIQGARRGATLTQRMLVFARRQELKNEIIDIPSLVYGMSDLLERSLGSSIAIDARFPAAISPVLTDSNQLEMALLNMVVNARDAMPGGGTITISAREQMLADRNVHGLKEGSYVVLSVTDRGAGMDIETLQHATEPFFTTKGVGKGTGLGLSMVHGLAEQSKGRLVLESEVGRGTIASLWLPMHQGDAEPILAPMNDRDAGETSVPSLSILAVDDDALVLMNTAAMLEDLGHKVTTAMSGSEAAKLLEINDPFDLLITDQGMPGMTGVELIAIARGQRPDLPVLLATGYADLPAGLALNVPRLPKPYMQEHLSKAVMEAMRRQVR